MKPILFPKAVILVAAILALALPPAPGAIARAGPAPAEVVAAFRDRLDHALRPPPDAVAWYGRSALEAMARAGIASAAQYVVVVDRNPRVQAVLVYWIDAAATPLLVGAASASTGGSTAFDHFETPLGVFESTLDNPDFRAEGTRNGNGIRGYGDKGLRVFDLGWQRARRLWGPGGDSVMRLQMHATDADRLEPLLGSARSKGCIRIPASLNRLLDHFGLLDADYLEAAGEGERPWVLPRDQEPADGAGRYVIVVESDHAQRPAWAPEGWRHRTGAALMRRNGVPDPPAYSGLPSTASLEQDP